MDKRIPLSLLPTPIFEVPPIPTDLLTSYERLVDFLNSDTRQFAEKLLAIYAHIDEWLPFVATFTTCSRKCSHCCKIDVHVSQMEADRIAFNLNRKYMVPEGHTSGHRAPCPFLIEDECSIYAFRPLSCRMHHVVSDPSRCADPSAMQAIYGFQSNPRWESLIFFAYEMTQRLGGVLADIRDFFPSVIQQDEPSLRPALREG